MSARAEKELARRRVLLEAGEATGEAKVVTMSSRLPAQPAASTAPVEDAFTEARLALPRRWWPRALMFAVVIVVALVAYRMSSDRGAKMRELAMSSASAATVTSAIPPAATAPLASVSARKSRLI